MKKMRQTFILDASYDYNTDITGIGIVIHETDNILKNKNGMIIDEMSESYLGIHSGKGEMLAIYRAVEIATERGYTHIRTRSDYNYIRKSLQRSYENNQHHDRKDMYGEILRLSRQFEKITFGYTPRRKNQMAHHLSRIALHKTTPIFRADLVTLTTGTFNLTDKENHLFGTCCHGQ